MDKTLMRFPPPVESVVSRAVGVSPLVDFSRICAATLGYKVRHGLNCDEVVMTR